VASRHYLRLGLADNPELQAEWPRWLQAYGVEVQHMAQVPHPDQPQKKAWVALTQSVRGDDLSSALASLSQRAGGAAVAAIYRVEDLA
jgi:hypothetical protein